MATLIIEGKRIKVSEDFLSLSPTEQEATVEEIAQNLKLEAGGGDGVMANLNRGLQTRRAGLSIW